MAKKRRITTDLARLLAIRYIQRAVINETLHAEETTPSSYGWCVEYAAGTLPDKWMDGQTSDQSWEHVWDEAHIQIKTIMACLTEEDRRIVRENPGVKV